jgi:hypothetical protein
MISFEESCNRIVTDEYPKKNLAPLNQVLQDRGVLSENEVYRAVRVPVPPHSHSQSQFDYRQDCSSALEAALKVICSQLPGQDHKPHISLSSCQTKANLFTPK